VTVTSHSDSFCSGRSSHYEMLCDLCPFASSMDISAECPLSWCTYQFIFLDFLVVLVVWGGGGGAALLNLYHISLAYELLPAVSIIIPYDMIQNFKMIFDLRNTIRSQRAKTRKFMCLSVLNTVISFPHDSQAQLFAEFWSLLSLCGTFSLIWQGECATGNENVCVSLGISGGGVC
jgi:hypothetical protein